MKKISIGLIVGTRGFFPSSLAEQGRKDMIGKLERSGFYVIIPAENSTPHGSVETVADAKIYADFFIENRKEIQGIIVTLPNFGDEL